MEYIVIKKDSFGLIQELSFTGTQYLVVTHQLLKLANRSKSRDLQNKKERLISEIERNGTVYRTCLKCEQYKYIGSIPGIVYRFFSLRKYTFLTNLLYTHSILTLYMFTLLNIALRFYTGMFS